MTLAAEVIVVGGGPAGSATAARLAEHGVDVLLLDRARFPREKPCGEFLSPGVVEELGRLGVLGRLRGEVSSWMRGMRVVVDDRGFVLDYEAAAACEGGASSAATGRLGLGMSRVVLDLALLDHARQRGARVSERTQATGAVISDGRVVGVRARESGGTERELRARLVVGADGHHSAVARSLGLDRRVTWPRRLGLVARYSGLDRLDGYGEMHVGGNVYCGLAPVGDGVVTVGLVAPLGDKPAGEPIERYLDRKAKGIATIGGALSRARRVSDIRGVGPLARRVSSVAGPGYLLVGDAAGFLDPFTGEGVFRALRGAELAAEGVTRALRRDDVYPEGYPEARRRAFRDKDMVCLVVQAFLARPTLFRYAAARLGDRPEVASRLASVLGDLGPAGAALRPGFLVSLLRPPWATGRSSRGEIDGGMLWSEQMGRQADEPRQ